MDETESVAAGPAWKVSFTLTKEDLAAFQRFYAARNRNGLRIAAAGAVTFAITVILLSSSAGTLTAAGIGLAGGSVASAMAWLNWHLTVRKQKTSGNLVHAEIGPDKIVVITDKLRIEHGFRTLTEIVRAGDATYYFYTKSDAFIVPDRAFGSPGEASASAGCAMELRTSHTAANSPLAAAASPFSVTFAMDDSAIAHQFYSRLGRKRWLKPGQVVSIILPLVFALLLGTIGVASLMIGRLRMPSTLVLVGSVCMLVSSYIRFAPAMVIKRYRAHIGNEPVAVTMTPSGLDLMGSDSSTNLLWASIKGIAEDDRAVFFDLEGTTWFIIPKAAFLDKAHYRSFVDAAYAYREGRQPKAPDMESWPPQPAGSAS